jgi:TP901 family phage tail tape measure protein
MAVSVPIVSSFDGQGIKKAIAQFKNLEGAGTKAQFAIKKAAVPALAAIGGFITIAQSSVKEFATFETSVSEVFTLLPELSAKAKKDIMQDVKDFSKEFGVLPEKTIPALYQAISAGIPKKNVFTFLETAQKAAKGGVTNLSTAVDGITSVVNAYGSEVIDATKASDLMFTAVKLGKTDFSQLSSSLYNVAPIAASLGVSFDVVTAALADLTAKGTPTSVAASQMKAALSELGKEGTKADKAFRDITGKGFQQFIKSGGSVEDAFVALSEGAGKSGQSVLDLFGSIEAGQAILSLTSDGGKKFGETLDQMAKSGGATQTAFEEMNKGSQVAFDKLGAAVKVLKIDLGEKLAPVVESFVKFLSDNMTTFVILGSTIGVIAAAVLIVNAGMMVYTAYTKAATAAQWLFNAAMNANPITLAVIAVGLLGAALVIAYKKFEPFRKIVDDVFGRMKWWINNITIPAVKALLAVFKTVFNGIASAWNNTVGKISFKLPKWIPGLGGKGFDMPDIPMLANGGIVDKPGGMLAMIGERGPEAVIPLTGPNAGAGLGGMNITVQAGLVSTPDQMGQLIIESIQRAQRRSGTVFQPA